MDIEIKAAIDGIDWCYSKELIQTETLKAKYKKGTRVYIVENQTDGLLKNIKTNSGRVLIGFLPDEAIDWVTCQEATGETVYGVIHKVEGVFPYLKVEVKLSINPIEIPKAQQSSRSAKTPIRQTKTLTPVLKPANNKAKHPITNKAFATKSLDKFIKDNRGVCGIYCIYSKEFATYIGQSVDVGGRVRKHFYELKSNKHHNTQMQKDWNDRAERFFTYHLIKSCDVEELDELEALYIEKYQTYRYGYNSTPDGQKSRYYVNEVTPYEVSYSQSLNDNIICNIDETISKDSVIEDQSETHNRYGSSEKSSTYSDTSVKQKKLPEQDGYRYKQHTGGIAEKFAHTPKENDSGARANSDKPADNQKSHFNTSAYREDKEVTSDQDFSYTADRFERADYEKILNSLTAKFENEANNLRLMDGWLMVTFKNSRRFSGRNAKSIKPFKIIRLSLLAEIKRFDKKLDISSLTELLKKIDDYIHHYT
ncbi:GIY-YIG nuclease family protein [Catenovulum adriaticum]|uniref:GIY-YIG nuclease family protein n=1 Tax=Catenovulum adriaticum TaxID=2984846 RepID=A0ABY7AN37_9ALTE|nr:GIY-YIG nuclease family protein [Catenovulum sp. TS8]WAJ69754.1 GIY-YIG nuclease family protein [Catenovulum sp. TS8]